MILHREKLIDISNSCNILFTLYATSFVGEVIALILQHRKFSKGRVILYGKLLYTCWN